MKYIIKLKSDSYVWHAFIAKGVLNEGVIEVSTTQCKHLAMTFSKKYLAKSIAMAVGGKVEEFI